jgi:hypothetical protein
LIAYLKLDKKIISWKVSKENFFGKVSEENFIEKVIEETFFEKIIEEKLSLLRTHFCIFFEKCALCIMK